MKRLKYLPILVLCSLILSPNIYAASMSLEAEKDAVISKTSVSELGGSSGNLRVGYENEKEVRTLIEFDLNDIPEGSTINSAKLRLFVNDYDWPYLDADYANVEVHRNTDNWSEGSVTWDNKPDTQNTGSNDLISDELTWAEWNITHTVQGWINEDYDNNGISLKAENEGENYRVKFSSRERSSNRPKLIVEYEEPEKKIVDVDVTPPILSNFSTQVVTHNTAKIFWMSDEITTARIDYGIEGPSGNSETDEAAMEHHVWLTELTPETQYIYKITSWDQAENEVMYGFFSFTTLEDPNVIDEATPPPDETIPPPDETVPPPDETVPPPDETTTPPPVENGETTTTQEETQESIEQTITEEAGTPNAEESPEIVYNTEDLQPISVKTNLKPIIMMGLAIGLGILVLVIILIAVVKRKHKTIPEEIKEEVLKKHKKVKVVVIITGTLLLLGLGSLAAHLLLTENLWISVNLHDEQQPQETVEIVAEIQTETPEETTQTTNNLLTPTKCTNQGITLELQLFEVGWECEIDSQPQFDAGYIKLTFDELTVTISNLGRGGPCRMGDDVVCENEDYVLSDVVNVKKYDDTFNQEIFGKLTEREDLWISIDYEDIAERDLTLEEKDSIIRILDSIKTIE